MNTNTEITFNETRAFEKALALVEKAIKVAEGTGANEAIFHVFDVEDYSLTIMVKLRKEMNKRGCFMHPGYLDGPDGEPEPVYFIRW